MLLRLGSIMPRTGRKTLCEMPRIFWTRIPAGRKIDFVIAGTQKGGTTALTNLLRQHPNVCMPRVKELHFFDEEANFSNGTVDYTRYHDQFTPKRSTLVFGESTPIYMYWVTAFERIWKYNAAMKIIILLRNPLERAYSHWNMEHNRGADKLPFSEAIRTEKRRISEAAPLQHRVYSYIDRGYYDVQLNRIWSFFPRTQVLVIKSDDLKAKPQWVLGEIMQFLSIGSAPTLNKINSIEAFVGKYDRAIPSEDWDYLALKFELSIRELEKMLNWRLDDWLARHIPPGRPSGRA